jgi:transposase
MIVPNLICLGVVLRTLIADPAVVRLVRIVPSADSLTLVAEAVQKQSPCPSCNEPSSRIHSRYTRKAADLPWQGSAVKIELLTRRFSCDNTLCCQRIFCERLPSVVAKHARNTIRLNQALALIGFALSGEAGGRLTAELGMRASPDTLLRLVRKAALQKVPTPRVLGVDDFAFRRGRRYGTILVDLERRSAIDLLPDREQSTLARWLKDRPGIEIITRDRSRAYAEAIAEGAPNATQVADRWHILKNLYEALERLLTRQHRLIDEAVRPTIPAPQPQSQPQPESKTESPPLISKQLPSQRNLLQPKREGVAERRLRRLALYTDAIRLREEGLSTEEIAEQIGKSKRTVQRWLNEGEFRHNVRRRRSRLDSYLPFLTKRWNEGCRNILQLWRELTEQGYSGSYKSLHNYMGRNFSPPPLLPELPPPPVQLVHNERMVRRIHRTGSAPLIPPPSPRQTLWMLLKPEELNETEQEVVKRLAELSLEIKKAVELAGHFYQLMKERNVGRLSEWIEKAKNSGIPELRAFVRGIENDQAVIEAAMSQEWSNGQVEGQVHRLKLLKRQMYGRAKFDLLRAKVLAA